MRAQTKRALIWIGVFLVSCLFFVGIPTLMLVSWSWQINATDQWPDLVRIGLMIMLPVLPLLFWYSRKEK